MNRPHMPPGWPGSLEEALDPYFNDEEPDEDEAPESNEPVYEYED